MQISTILHSPVMFKITERQDKLCRHGHKWGWGPSSASFRVLTAALRRGEENKYVIAQGIRRWLTASPSEASPLWIINHHLKDPGRKSAHNYSSYTLGRHLGLLCMRGKTVNTASCSVPSSLWSTVHFTASEMLQRFVATRQKASWNIYKKTKSSLKFGEPSFVATSLKQRRQTNKFKKPALDKPGNDFLQVDHLDILFATVEPQTSRYSHPAFPITAQPDWATHSSTSHTFPCGRTHTAGKFVRGSPRSRTAGE